MGFGFGLLSGLRLAWSGTRFLKLFCHTSVACTSRANEHNKVTFAKLADKDKLQFLRSAYASDAIPKQEVYRFYQVSRVQDKTRATIPVVQANIDALEVANPRVLAEELILYMEHFIDYKIRSYLKRIYLISIGKLDFKSHLDLVSNSALVLNSKYQRKSRKLFVEAFRRRLGEDERLDFHDFYTAMDLSVKMDGFNMCKHNVLRYITKYMMIFSTEEMTRLLELFVLHNKVRQFRNFAFMQLLKEYVLTLLSSCDEANQSQELEKCCQFLEVLMTFFQGLKYFDEDIMASIQKLLYGPYNENVHSARFLGALIHASAHARYFDETLCDYVNNYFVLNLLTCDAYGLYHALMAFVALNYNHSVLLEKVVKVYTTKRVINMHIQWAIMNSCLYHNKYYREIVTHFLNNNNIRDSLAADRKGSRKRLLMRLLFSLVVENPQLQLAKCSTEVTDYYPYQIKGLSSNFSMEALEYYLRHYQELRSSSRSSECLHALEIVTNGFVHHEVATLIGYVIDFELSFKNKKFQQLPDCLLNMPLEVGLNAIRPHRISDTEMMSASKHQSKELNFDKLKEDKERRRGHVNFATDWIKVFGGSSFALQKRVAIEWDGPFHWARNDPSHLLGRTVIKERLIKAMGWTYIRIPYYEWQPLETTDEQIEFVKKIVHKAIHE